MNNQTLNYKGVEYKLLFVEIISGIPVDIWLCQKLFSNCHVVAIIGVLPRDAEIPSKERFTEFLQKVDAAYDMENSMQRISNDFGLPIDVSIAFTSPGVDLFSSMREMFQL